MAIVGFDNKQALLNYIFSLIDTNNDFETSSLDIQSALFSTVESLWDQGGLTLVNVDDSTPQYLADKLSAGTGITINVVDNAGVKSLEIVNSAASTSDELVKTNALDPTAGYLEDKVVAGEGVSVTTSVGNDNIEVGLIVSTDLAIYVVDGNNTQEGVGSQTNPFWTIDRVVERLLGEDGSPVPSGRPTVVVRAYEGANYAVNRNLWLNCNWVFEVGAKVTSTANESTFLFDQDHATGTRGLGFDVAPNVYGQPDFDLDGVSGFKSSDTQSDPPSETTTYDFQFARMNVTNGDGIRLGPTAYAFNSAKYNIFKISGQNGAAQGELLIQSNGYYAFTTEAGTGTAHAVWDVYNVIFNDRSSGTGGGNSFIEFNTVSYSTRFEDITIASGGTQRVSYIALKGTCQSLQVNNFVFTKGGTTTSLIIFDIQTSSGTFDNIITNAVCSYNGAPGSPNARFMKHTSGTYNNQFFLHNISSNIPLEGVPSDYSDLETEGLNVFAEKAYAGDLVLNKKTTTEASTAALDINSDNIKQASLTAQAAVLQINAPTGTPADGTEIAYRVKDDGGGPYNIDWVTAGVFDNLSLAPATTVSLKTIYVKTVYNSGSSKWDIVDTVVFL